VSVLVERHREHVVPARAQHAMHFGVRAVRIGHVFEHVGRQDQVDRRNVVDKGRAQVAANRVEQKKAVLDP